MCADPRWLRATRAGAECLQALGGIAAQRGKAGRAERHKEAALWLARQVGDRAQVAVLLADLGVSAMNRGEFALVRGMLLRQGMWEEAEVYVQEGLTLARKAGNRELEAYLL